RDLLANAGLIRFPAESAQYGLAGFVIPDVIRSAVYTGFLLFPGEAQDRLFRHGFQQSHSDHRGRDARRNHDVLAEISELQVPEFDTGRAQGNLLAIREDHLPRLVMEDGTAFRGNPAGNAPVLQLVAVGGMRPGFAVRRFTGNTEPDQHSAFGLFPVRGRLGAAVVQVAVSAAVFVEGRAQAPDAAGIRRHDPGLVELLLALGELRELLCSERRDRNRVGVAT